MFVQGGQISDELCSNARVLAVCIGNLTDVAVFNLVCGFGLSFLPVKP